MRSGGFARGAKGAEARGAQRPAGAPSQRAGAAAGHAARLPAAAPLPARRAAAPPRAAPSAPAAPAAPAAAAPAAAPASPAPGTERPLRVIIAGAGIGGLVAAVGLLKRGFEVRVLERDLTAIRGEGQYRGPIQLQSNALAALEALDARVAERVMAAGCITGDRINGLCDGVTGEWYCKFDTFHPAVDRGLPVTRVVSRFALQEILADAVRALGGPGVIENDVHVLGYEHGVDAATGAPTATAVLEDGRRLEADLLVAADGIRSKLRARMVGASEPAYSAYTCYTGIADFTPPDIDLVGYRVFLGNRQYFVSSDVGGGRMQVRGSWAFPSLGWSLIRIATSPPNSAAS
jgi:zeaxanthin epoxidase